MRVSEFSDLCSNTIVKDAFASVEDQVSRFSELLIDIAAKTIPKSSANPRSKQKPWFNTDCAEAIKDGKKPLILLRNPLIVLI